PARRDLGSQPVPRGRLDRHRLAGDDGGRGAQRAQRRARGARRCRPHPCTPPGDRSMSDAVRTLAPPTDDHALSETRAAMERTCQRLFATQDPRGFWKGELETNVTMDAEDLLLREFLGIRTADETKHAALWIRSQQRADGSWGTFKGGPAELSTTVEAYVALRLAGDPLEATHMRRAAGLIRSMGGLGGARVFTRFWMALFGLWSGGGRAGAAARGGAPAALVPAQRVRLQLLGAPDDRAAHDRGRAPAGAAAVVHDRRAARRAEARGAPLTSHLGGPLPAPRSHPPLLR